MTLVYDRTESLLLGMLMHGSLTATVLIMTPSVTGVALLAYGLSFAAGTWPVIGLLRRQPVTAGDRRRPDAPHAPA